MLSTNPCDIRSTPFDSSHVIVDLLPNLNLSSSIFLPFSSALLCFLALHFFLKPNPSPWKALGLAAYSSMVVSP